MCCFLQEASWDCSSQECNPFSELSAHVDTQVLRDSPLFLSFPCWPWELLRAEIIFLPEVSWILIYEVDAHSHRTRESVSTSICRFQRHFLMEKNCGERTFIIEATTSKTFHGQLGNRSVQFWGWWHCWHLTQHVGTQCVGASVPFIFALCSRSLLSSLCVLSSSHTVFCFSCYGVWLLRYVR